MVDKQRAGQLLRFPTDDGDEPVGADPAEGRPIGRLAGVLTVAGAVVLSVVFGVHRVPVPVLEDGQIEPVPSEDRPIPRGDTVLRWKSRGAGVVYTVEVLTDELVPVAVGQNLDRAAFRLPDDAALTRVRGLVWRVHARYPDGSERQSRAFYHRLASVNRTDSVDSTAPSAPIRASGSAGMRGGRG